MLILVYFDASMNFHEKSDSLVCWLCTASADKSLSASVEIISICDFAHRCTWRMLEVCRSQHLPIMRSTTRMLCASVPSSNTLFHASNGVCTKWRNLNSRTLILILHATIYLKNNATAPQSTCCTLNRTSQCAAATCCPAGCSQISSRRKIFVSKEVRYRF